MENDIQKLEAAATKELFSWPHTSLKHFAKVFVKILLRYPSTTLSPYRYSWPNALLAKSLATTDHNTPILNKYYSSWQKRNLLIKHIDCALHGEVLLDLYKQTGNNRYLKMCHSLYKYLLNSPRDKYGNFYYRPGDKKIFIDTIGMISPFLANYSIITDKPEALTLAKQQVLNFTKYGLDADTNLPFHGYDAEKQKRYGELGWGRGMGWFMLGLSGILKHLPKNDPDYKTIKKVLLDLTERTIALQNNNGLLPWSLTSSTSHPDTSATAMVFTSIQQAINDKILPSKYQKNVILAINGIKPYISSSGLFLSSAECNGLGKYPQKYGAYPWSTGPALYLLAVSKK